MVDMDRTDEDRASAMSDTIAQEFAVPRAGRAHDLSADDVDRTLTSLVAERHEVSSWGSSLETQIGASALPIPSDQAAVRLSTDVFRRLTVRLSEGNVIVADPEGAAYGVGPSYAEAMEEWTEAAREHFEDLRQQESRLHPRMRRQLVFLASIFG